MKKYIVEFIGTFFLVLTIVATVNDAGEYNYLPPLAIGAALTALVYAGGPISAAHYNPAVTMAFLMRKKMKSREVPGYLIAQLLGAILAALLGALVFAKGSVLSATGLPENLTAAFFAEVLGTFALVWVILQVATNEKTAGNSYYGIAIGLIVIGIAYAFGSYGTAGCFNPAVAIGAVFNGLISWGTAALAIVSSLIGSALAFLAYNVSYTED